MDKCSTCQYNPQILDRLKNQLPDEDVTDKLSEMFKVFGDSTRIRILWTLFDKELCVYDIANALGMSQSAISHQLKTLKQARLIKSRRDGKNAFYSIDDDHVKKIIEQMLIHIEENYKTVQLICTVFDCCFIINKIEYCRNNCGDSPADRPRKPYSDFRIKCV